MVKYKTAASCLACVRSASKEAEEDEEERVVPVLVLVVEPAPVAADENEGNEDAAAEDADDKEPATVVGPWAVLRVKLSIF
jgi:hypothetical protein